MINYGNGAAFYGKTPEETEALKADIIFAEINARNQFLTKKREEIRAKVYEGHLIENDIAAIIREDINSNLRLNIFATHDGPAMLENASLTFQKEVFEKLSEENKKLCEESLLQVKTIVGAAILNNDKDFVMVDIAKLDKGDFYILFYQYKNVQMFVGIPMFSRANNTNFESLLNGYSIGYKEDNNNAAHPITQLIRFEDLYNIFLNWYKQKYTPAAPAAPAAPAIKYDPELAKKVAKKKKDQDKN